MTLNSRDLGRAAVEQLAAWLAESYDEQDTDHLAKFWLGACEACVERIVELKPEMVTRIGPSDAPLIMRPADDD